MARRPTRGGASPVPDITSSSPCRPRSAPSRPRTRPPSMTSCSRSPRDPHHDRRRPEASGARTPTSRPPHLGLGADPSSRVHVIVPGGACRRTDRAIACKPGFFRPCACCRAGSAASFSKALRSAAQGHRLSSSATCPARRQLRLRRRSRAAPPARWSTPRGRSPDLRPSSPILSPSTFIAVAISNRELTAASSTRRASPSNGRTSRIKRPRPASRTTTSTPPEFIRRFLLHVLPSGFHRIRHGLFAGHGSSAQHRAASANCSPRPLASSVRGPTATKHLPLRARVRCGRQMIIVETFEGIAP